MTGKTPGTDLRERVPTMPALLLRARAAQDGLLGRGPPTWSRLLDGDLSGDDDLAAAVAALRVHPVVEDTRARAVALAQAAVRELDPLPAGPVKDALDLVRRRPRGPCGLTEPGRVNEGAEPLHDLAP